MNPLSYDYELDQSTKMNTKTDHTLSNPKGKTWNYVEHALVLALYYSKSESTGLLHRDTG